MSRGAGQRGLNRYGTYADGPIVGVEGYGVKPTVVKAVFDAQRSISHVLEKASATAKQAYATFRTPYIGLRETAWGGEVIVFDRLAGVQRWAAEQSADRGVWYAVAFDLTMSDSPFAEVVR